MRCTTRIKSRLVIIYTILYINDLPNCVKQTQVSMFADDTNLSTSGSSLLEIENMINNDLHNANAWLETNKLTLITGKTEFMSIASKKKRN